MGKPFFATSWLLLFVALNGSTQESKTFQVDIKLAGNCATPTECFSSLSQCSKEHKEQLKLSFTKVSSFNTLPNSPISSLFDNSQGQLDVVLYYYKTEPHYEIKKSRVFNDKVIGTEVITGEVLYHKDQYTAKQFKTINEFYGEIHGPAEDVLAFIRTNVQFTGCGQLLLFGFIRHHKALYQIRPHLELLQNTSDLNGGQNIHEITLVTDGIDSSIFSNQSEALKPHRTRRDTKDHRYCLIKVLADRSFYERMNSNLHQVVIYIRTAFMLAEEIFANSDWPDEEERYYKPRIPEIQVDLAIASEVGHIDKETVLKKLLNIKDRNEFCLAYIFTDDLIVDNGVLLNGFTNGSVFAKVNVGITSINNCKDDPWKLQCLLTFPHELARSFGPDHDVGSYYRSNWSFVMQQINEMSTEIWPNNLKLSNESIMAISMRRSETADYYVKAGNWSICGNGLIEVGEECDEGKISLCCSRNCRLKENATCSPLNTLCCTERCQLKLKSERSCVPWSYCSSERQFCQNKEAFCESERIAVNCEALSRLWTTSTSTLPSDERGDSEEQSSMMLWWIVVGVSICSLVAIIAGWVFCNSRHKKTGTDQIDDAIEHTEMENLLNIYTDLKLIVAANNDIKNITLKLMTKLELLNVKKKCEEEYRNLTRAIDDLKTNLNNLQLKLQETNNLEKGQ